jgi:hypothetical protein
VDEEHYPFRSGAHAFVIAATDTDDEPADD